MAAAFLFFFSSSLWQKRKKKKTLKTDHKNAAHVHAPTHATPQETLQHHHRTQKRPYASERASSKGSHIYSATLRRQLHFSFGTVKNAESMTASATNRGHHHGPSSKRKYKVACGRAGGILAGPAGASPFTQVVQLAQQRVQDAKRGRRGSCVGSVSSLPPSHKRLCYSFHPLARPCRG